MPATGELYYLVSCADGEQYSVTIERDAGGGHVGLELFILEVARYRL